MLDRLRYLLAIESLVAAQAVDLAAPGTDRPRARPCSTKPSGRASSPLDEDRSSTDDIEQIAADVFGPTALDTLLDQSGIGANWSLGERAGW